MGLIACQRGPKNTRMLDDAARAALRLIVRLKGAGLSLAEIADFLTDQTSDAASLRKRLATHLAVLDAQRQAIADFLTELEDAPRGALATASLREPSLPRRTDRHHAEQQSEIATWDCIYVVL